MKQHIVSLPHHPKRVIVISLVIAIAVGTFGYFKINQKPVNPYKQSDLNAQENKDSYISQKQNLTLGFLSGGRIKTVLVKTGDEVKKGDVLAALDAGNASGVLIQAEASYSTAKANYEKVVNGATYTDVTVTNTSVEISEATFAHNKETLVLTLNNSLTAATNAVNNNTNNIFDNPNSANPEFITTDMSFTNQQLENNIVNERIQLNATLTSWKSELTGVTTNSDIVNLTNSSLNNLQTVATYMDDLNSLFTLYCSVSDNNSKAIIANILSARASITSQITLLTNALQAVSSAEKNVDQSHALLTQKTSAARPEDVAIAEAQVNNAYGAVQIAEAAFQNTIITAPFDGVVISVSITPGQIAIPNAPAIEFLSKTLEAKTSI